MKVEIAFDLAPNGVGNWFTLDDAVKGALDNVTYTLSGDVLTDVTDYVRSVSVKRGRNRTLEKFSAGVAGVELDNRTRVFDPLYASSPYFGNIGPRKQIRISVEGEYLFSGNVEDWDYGYSVNGDSVADVKAVDGFGILAPVTLTPGTAVSQLTGARVDAVLDALDWPTTQRAVSAGNATLNADVVGDGVNALSYLQKVEVSEPGALFIAKDGAFTFKDRDDLQTYTSGITFGTAGIPFQGIGVVYGTDEMTNSVAVTYYGGTVVAGTAVASDATSQAAYGVINATYDTLLDSLTDAQSLADWTVNQYKDPIYRVDSLTVRLGSLTATQRAQVLALDLGDAVEVDWTPNNVGSSISQIVTIDGVSHSATPTNHDVTFTLSQTIAAFILDDLVYGALDENYLGF